jgi:hypothetical protein
MSLVKFRAMVQDNGLSPEIYKPRALLRNEKTGETVSHTFFDGSQHCDECTHFILPYFACQKPITGHFLDELPADLKESAEDDYIFEDSDRMDTNFCQKLPVICTSLPGETEWTRKVRNAFLIVTILGVFEKRRMV